LQKLIQEKTEMEEKGFESFNTVRPDEATPQANVSEEPTAVAGNEGGEPSAQVEPQTEPTGEPTTVVEPQTDEFIENFNKRYNTQYKADDEIKNLFSLTGKVTEYEGKLKDHESLVESVDKYKKELEELKGKEDFSGLLDKPRIRKAYVAEQLIAKHPDLDPDILSSVAISDLDKMTDIEVIAKERMINVKGLTFDEARLAKLADFGIDSETNPEEWDGVAKARIKIAAAEARERVKSLLGGIEVPKPISAEEIEAKRTKALEEKVKATAPIKEIFTKFDTYKNGEFEFTPPDEFKSKLGDIWNGFFIDGGLEVNEENISTAELIKEALFVKEYLPKMLEVHEKTIRAKLKEEQDALLHNDMPPNTATATDQGDSVDPDKPGLNSFFQNQQQRATKF